MQKQQIIETIGQDVISNVYCFKIYMTHASDDSFSWSRMKKVDELKGIWRSSPDFPLYDELSFDRDFMRISKNNEDTYININYISAIVIKKYSQEKE